MRRIITILFSLSFSLLWGQTIESIPYGDFQQWTVREIKESPLLGGMLKRLHIAAPGDTIRGNHPYRQGASPWGSSNVMAVVAGITKASSTVLPIERGPGDWCARMESKYEGIKVLGMVNITVMVSGSIYLGEAMEPIRNVNNPYSKINMGIPFSKHPTALIFDYRAGISESGIITKATGFSFDEWEGLDCAHAFIFLQNRKEAPDGSIIATRIGTGYHLFCESTKGWINDFRLPIHYGDVSNRSDYHPMMKLDSFLYAKNSKGEMVSVQERGWGDRATPVTHLVLMLAAGSQGAFVGTLGNLLDVDNFKLEY